MVEVSAVLVMGHPRRTNKRGAARDLVMGGNHRAKFRESGFIKVLYTIRQHRKTARHREPYEQGLGFWGEASPRRMVPWPSWDELGQVGNGAMD